MSLLSYRKYLMHEKEDTILARSTALRGPIRSEPIQDLDEVLEAGALVGQEIKDLRRASNVT